VVSERRKAFCVAEKLKYHRLKPGGVRATKGVLCSRKVEVPPAKAWWCPRDEKAFCEPGKLKYHRLKPGGVELRFLCYGSGRVRRQTHCRSFRRIRTFSPRQPSIPGQRNALV